MFKLSVKSLSRLEGVHPNLVKVVKEAIKNSPIDFIVIEGLRTTETQKEYVRKGASKTMNSKHLIQKDGYSHAVDLAPLVKGTIDWNDWSKFELLSQVIKQEAKQQGVNITWGGDWKSFRDGPHYQLEL